MRFLRLLKRHRLAVLALLVLGSIGNSLRFIGEWNNFWVVVTGQIFLVGGFIAIWQIELFIWRLEGRSKRIIQRKLGFWLGCSPLVCTY